MTKNKILDEVLIEYLDNKKIKPLPIFKDYELFRIAMEHYVAKHWLKQ